MGFSLLKISNHAICDGTAHAPTSGSPNARVRTSRETSKFFDATGNIEAHSQPRRVTRSSLSRFALGPAFSAEKSPPSEHHLPLDIEDAAASTSRKRRRVSSDRSGTTVKTEEAEIDSISASRHGPTPRRARKPARVTKDPTTGGVTVSAPSDWEEMYKLVLDMRAPGGVASNAAVDTMGCACLADRNASEKDQRFHTLVALMLSSQTKDTVTAVVMRRLQTELPAHKPGAPVGLNLENVLAVEPDVLNEMIWTVGFHNNKTKYVESFAPFPLGCLAFFSTSFLDT